MKKGSAPINGNKVRIAPHVISRIIDEDTILVNLESERMFTLNSSGTRFWQLLEEGKELDQIRRQTMREFDVDEQEIENEIGDLLPRLIEEELVIVD